ncbi:MAG: hypothetical protein KA444_04240 [Bacteroidia bacterium]|nr:hypothetical protein [Bacteroidia bacterium]
MKVYLIIAIGLLSLSACNQAELDRAKQENDSLMSVVNERNTAINEFIGAFNDVERNLDSVAIRQHVITVNSDQKGELKHNQKERINAEITAINDLMDENRKKLADLNKKLKNSSYKNKELLKTIDILSGQLAQKDIELTALNEKLNNLNAQVTQLETNVNVLTEENKTKAQIIADETMALHTAYFVVGKSKELQETKLIDRQGGLLGIGKTSKLAANFDNSKFTRIDYTQTTNIPINSKDVKIITSHASDSYTLDKDASDKDKVNNLIITNPEKFWSASKYLVVVKN